MIEFRSLASSSSGNCYFVTDGESPIMIECGIRMQDIRQGLGYRAAGLQGVLLSHSHGDHSKSVLNLMKLGIDIYTSQGTADVLGLSGYRLRVVKSLESFWVGSWKMKPFDVRHDDPEPLGFIMTNRSGESLAYITDTAYVPYRFEKLTVLAIECNYSMEILRRNSISGLMPSVHMRRVAKNHMGLERVLTMLAANDLSKVREIHLLHLSEVNSDEEMFREAVIAATGKPVYISSKRSIST